MNAINQSDSKFQAAVKKVQKSKEEFKIVEHVATNSNRKMSSDEYFDDVFEKNQDVKSYVRPSLKDGSIPRASTAVQFSLEYDSIYTIQ